MKRTWRVLSVGNSFSMDTMEHLGGIAKGCGMDEVVLGDLYVGGCSIRKHASHLEENAAVYEYLEDRGDGWSITPAVSIAEAVQREPWDVISIQHGSADGSLYTDPVYYERLPFLVRELKALAPQARIAFNMTWAGDPDHPHSEIVRFGGDQEALYRAIADTTEQAVCTVAGIERVSPTGTAVQLARRSGIGALTRDGYHLSLDRGRYLAGLTFFKTLTGAELHGLSWAPDGVTPDVREALIRVAEAAVLDPFDRRKNA